MEVVILSLPVIINNIIDIGQGYHIHHDKDDDRDNKEVIELTEKIGKDLEEENILIENC